MNSKRSLQIEMEGLTGLRSLVETYEEIAAQRMQKVREEVLIARQFLDGLAGVFGEVRAAQKTEARLPAGKPALPNNGRTIAVFISANAGLYGDIVERTLNKFLDYVTESGSEAVVVGKLGVKLVQQRRPQLLYNYFDLSDDAIEVKGLAMIMRYLLQFEKIVVFYGKFRSLLNQEVMADPVSGDQLYKGLEGQSDKGAEKKLEYLFEPELPRVLQFFESQILTTIFEQTVHESQLAKFASRLLSLDRAVDNVQKRMGQVRFLGQRLSHRLKAKDQLGLMAGVSLWG